MPVKDLPSYGPIPNGWKPVAPEGFEQITDPSQVTGLKPKPKANMVEITGNALMSLFPGHLGPGYPSLADETAAEIRSTGQKTEQFLGGVIQPLIDMSNKAFGVDPNKVSQFTRLPGGVSGYVPTAPQPSGADVAQGLLSPQTGRAVLETGASMLATAPVGGTGALPALGRTLAGAAGGAYGSLLSEGFDPSKTPGQSAAAAALTHGAAQGVSEGLMSLIGGTALESGGREAIHAIAARGGVIPPGQVSKSAAVDFLQSLTSKSFGGAPTIEKARSGAEAIATKMASDFVDGYTRGATKQETGELLANAVRNSREHFDTVMNAGYRAVDQVAGGIPVDMQPVKQLAAQILADATKKVGSKAVQTLAQDILDRPDILTFKDAGPLRSSLGKIVGGDAESVSIKGDVEAAGARLKGAVNEQMQLAAAKGLNPQGYAFWKALDKAYAEGAEGFNGKVVQSIATKDPDSFYNYGVKNNTPSGIKSLRGIVNSDPAWENIQGQYAKDLVNQVSDSQGRIDGKRLAASLKAGQGEEKFSAAFSPTELNNLRNIARTLEITQSDIGSKTAVGGLAMQLSQGSALFGGGGLIVGLASGKYGVAGSSAAVLILPAMLAKVLTNGPMSRLLTIGLMAPPGSKAALNAFSHFAAAAGRAGLTAPVEPISQSREAQEPQ